LGNQTRESVIAAQKVFGLTPDGVVGADEEKLESCFDYAWWKPSSSAGKRK
ncbi:MAG: peptidoglycan-binding protein, partial [Lentisphaeria bacterium]|nr:peptidoglycan-binding protein [Lentisphaeria bacterium]